MVLKNKKASQGIGTLIIFISMVLVAAVAAGVLIQTSSSLQSKALDVGKQSQERVTTTMDIVKVYAEDASDHMINNGTDKITAIVRLGAGSEAIKLSDLKIRFSTNDFSQMLEYNSTPSAIHFSSSTGQDYIMVGDSLNLEFLAPVDIKESTGVRLLFIPKMGTPYPVDVTTPSVMVAKILDLR